MQLITGLSKGVLILSILVKVGGGADRRQGGTMVS